MTSHSKKTRLHAAINKLTPEEVAAIVKQAHPRVKGKRVDELAREAIAAAHRLVSPRK